MSAVLSLLSAAAANPVVQSVVLLALGYALKVGKDVAVAFIRARAASGVKRAEDEVVAAASTPDAKDDAAAADHLAKAKVEQQVLEAIADAMAKQDPVALARALAQHKNLPPDVLAVLSGGKP